MSCFKAIYIIEQVTMSKSNHELTIQPITHFNGHQSLFSAHSVFSVHSFIDSLSKI